MSDYTDVRVGALLKDGYCSGLFGRDCYKEHRIEALGYDWVVTRNNRGECHTATGDHDWLYEALHDSINYNRDEDR